MSDTPRTDANKLAHEHFKHWGFENSLDEPLVDWPDFARELERERNEAREYADKLAEGMPDGMLPKDVEVLREANLGLAMELAEARAELKRVDEYATDLCCTLRCELDEARETIDNLETRHAAVMLFTQTVVDDASAKKKKQRDKLADAVRLLMDIIGPADDEVWADSDQIERAWNAGKQALAAVKGATP